MQLVCPDEPRTAEFAEVIAHAFAFPPEQAPEWFERAGLENLRVLLSGNELLGGLVLIPMGQYFGGRRLPMVGVAGVAIAPERRGAGVGTTLMRSCIQELHALGVPLSVLYPATLPLYQRAGYERAGARYQVEVALRSLPPCREPAVRRVSPEDPLLRSLYERHARARNGYLCRGPYVWGRVFRPMRRPVAQAWAVGEEGYVAYFHERLPSGEFELTVTDLVAPTAAAAMRILGMLGEYRAMTSLARWTGGSPDLVTWVLPERHFKVEVLEYWMLRLVHLGAAFMERGYPRPLRATLDFEVEDEVVAANSGRWRLVVEDGHGRLEPGGTGALKLGVRALAALYTGFLPCETLVAAGDADCDSATAELASLVFAGPRPAMPDMF